MYITLVEIDTNNRTKQRELSHPGAVHSWVEDSFPDEIARNVRTRKPWRTDSLKGKQLLLIVSPTHPALDVLERRGVSGTARTKSYGAFLESIQTGDRARFKVCLNPVVAVKEKKGQRGRVKPHVTVAQQKQFLLDRSTRNGFLIKEEEFEITERTYVPLLKQGQQAVELSKVTYEGVLTVGDKELFQRTLTEGFGKKKAYGFGLMTIIPIEQHG